MGTDRFKTCMKLQMCRSALGLEFIVNLFGREHISRVDNGTVLVMKIGE